MKKSFTEAKEQSPVDFKRDAGVSIENFHKILELVEKYINDDLEKNPNKVQLVFYLMIS